MAPPKKTRNEKASPRHQIVNVAHVLPSAIESTKEPVWHLQLHELRNYVLTLVFYRYPEFETEWSRDQLKSCFHMRKLNGGKPSNRVFSFVTELDVTKLVTAISSEDYDRGKFEFRIIRPEGVEVAERIEHLAENNTRYYITQVLMYRAKVLARFGENEAEMKIPEEDGVETV